jgi:hypothetical protein
MARWSPWGDKFSTAAASIALAALLLSFWPSPQRSADVPQFEILRVDALADGSRVTFLYHEPSGWCFLRFARHGQFEMQQVYSSLCYFAMEPARKARQDEKDRLEREATELFWREFEKRKAEEQRKSRSESD